MEKVLNWCSNPYIYLTTIVFIAIGIGAYGLYILINLKKVMMFDSPGQQVDQLMIGTVNIAVSLLSLCLVSISFMQMDTNALLLQILFKIK